MKKLISCLENFFSNDFVLECKTIEEALFVTDFFNIFNETNYEFEPIKNNKKSIYLACDYNLFEDKIVQIDLDSKHKFVKKVSMKYYYNKKIFSCEEFKMLLSEYILTYDNVEYQDKINILLSKYTVIKQKPYFEHISTNKDTIIETPIIKIENTLPDSDNKITSKIQGKVCSKCQIFKPFTEFYKRAKESKDGYNAQCKCCMKKIDI